MDWVDYVRERPGQAIDVEYRRGMELLQATIVPELVVDDSGESIGRVGLGVQFPEMPPEMLRKFERGPVEALGASSAAHRRAGGVHPQFDQEDDHGPDLAKKLEWTDYHC